MKHEVEKRSNHRSHFEYNATAKYKRKLTVIKMEKEIKLDKQLANAKIISLKQKLYAQNNSIHYMRIEMYQLQSRMEKENTIKQAEVKEIQQYVMDGLIRTTGQEREINKLKMAIEDKNLRH